MNVRDEVARQTVALLHARTPHMGVSSLQRLARSGAVEGLGDAGALLLREQSASVTDRMNICGGCTQGKSHRAPLGKGKPPEWSEATHPMQRWDVDLIGPMPESLGSNRYALLAVDCYSSKKMIGFIAKKSDAQHLLRDWYHAAKTYHGRPLQEIHSDGGGEFMSHELLDFWSNEGVKVSITTPHTPQHNGRAERHIRTVVSDCRSLLFHAGAPVELWADAMKAAVYLRNMLHIGRGRSKTPNQLWHNGTIAMIEKMTHIRVLFCDAWVHVPDADRTKLEPKSRLCLFIGYDDMSLGYRFLHVESTPYRIIISLDAIFDEKKFTQCVLLREHIISGENGGRSAAAAMTEQEYEEYLDCAFNEAGLRLGILMSEYTQQSPSSQSTVSESLTGSMKKSVRFGESITSLFYDEHDDLYDWDDDPDSDNESSSYAPSVELGPTSERRNASTRMKITPHRYGMVDMLDVVVDDIDQVRAIANVQRSILEEPDYDAPLTLAQMRSAPDAIKFEQAIEAENASLLEKGVMNEVNWSDIPSGMKPIPTKYIGRRKVNALGELEKHKARLVVQGFWQKHGIDFDEKELYAPTLSATSFRLLFAVLVQLEYRWRVVDVKTAFLNATLKHVVYVTLPKGSKNELGADGRPRVFRLMKALYGLKQAPKEWNTEFDSTLQGKCGLTRLKKDPCVYTKKMMSGHRLYVCIFVDDTVFLHHTDDASEVESLISIIKSVYDVSDGGESSSLLGMRLTRGRDDGSLTIDQQNYIERVLERARPHMSSIVPVATPEVATTQLTTIGAINKNVEKNKLIDTDILDMKRKELYHSLVGALLYAAVWTRPDITHAVGQLTRYVAEPRVAHWKALERVLRYLKSSTHLGLRYNRRVDHDVDGVRQPNSSIILGPVFADANWAGDIETRRSTTGIIVKLNNNVIWWCSKRQPSVARSSTEAEYMALGDAASEIVWLRQLLDEMSLTQSRPTRLYGDNESSMITANNEMSMTRMKHIDIRYHSIREQIAQFKTIELASVRSESQQADILTKSLNKVIFNRLRHMITYAHRY